jgi:transcriptional regulator with XRE-family HTH domain
LSEGVYDALGHTIKVARTDLGIDRKDLARAAGISYSYLAAIENGHKQPSSGVLLALAEALGLRTHELLESAEGRRVRNLTVTESYPQWLTEPEPQLAAPAAIRPSIMADSFEATPVADDADAGTEEFLRELTELATTVAPRDRRLLLDLASRLVGRA